jgi:hypothetical protein
LPTEALPCTKPANICEPATIAIRFAVLVKSQI